MPAWLAAVPIIGGLFEKVGEAIDRNVTSDEERLKAKTEMMTLMGPVLVAVLEAEKSANELRIKLAEVEARAEDRLVRWRRPIISLLGTLHGCVALWLYVGGVIPYEAGAAIMAFGGALGGLDIVSRGVEKTVASFSLDRIPGRK